MIKTIDVYKFFPVIILIFLSNQIFSQTRIEGEIILGALGTGNNGWYYEWRADSELRWWSDHYLTDSYYSGESTYNDRETDTGFALSSPTSSGEYDIAYGIYIFTFICNDLKINKSFCIDLRDANWSMEQPPYPFPVDLYIRYNNDVGNKKFQYRLASTGNWKDLDSPSTIWELWHDAPPNQEVFQPTSPLLFTCSNPNASGEHPLFTWLPPQGPDFLEDFPWNFKYNIYRKENGQSFQIVAEDLTGNKITELEWTDMEITIGRPGGFYTYYAVAHTGSSPESKPTDQISIRGNPSKQLPGDGENDTSDNNINYQKPGVQISICPNPFNPVAKISYFVPEQRSVRLSIYNLNGQKITELINEFKYPGEYAINFSGRSLPGGVYFVRLQIKNQQLTRKILLLK